METWWKPWKTLAFKLWAAPSLHPLVGELFKQAQKPRGRSHSPDTWGERHILGQIKQWLNIADPMSHSSVLQRASPDKVAEARKLLHFPMPSSCCKKDRSGAAGAECSAPSPKAPCVEEQFWARQLCGSTYIPHTPGVEGLELVD